jgi:hypothetical protein
MAAEIDDRRGAGLAASLSVASGCFEHLAHFFKLEFTHRSSPFFLRFSLAAWAGLSALRKKARSLVVNVITRYGRL